MAKSTPPTPPDDARADPAPAPAKRAPRKTASARADAEPTPPARKRAPRAPEVSDPAPAAAPDAFAVPAGPGVAGAAPPRDGRVRAVIDAVEPQVDGGRFAAKCIAGEPTDLVAHVFTDGHDRLRAILEWGQAGVRPGSDPGLTPEGAQGWAGRQEVEMTLDVNDEWHAAVTFPEPGRYVFSVTAWVDAFRSWRHDFSRRVELEDLRVAALVGAELAERTAERAGGEGANALRAWAQRLREAGGQDAETIRGVALDPAPTAIAERHPDRSRSVTFPQRTIVADRARARFSSWYELFPRSAAPEPGRHGTFADVEARLPYVASMGFDVLYLPPIHPIGRDKRKGPNNALAAGPDDVGSPWAIGAAEGGHTAIHPALGTAEDFRRLVGAARERGIDVALDIALQCAPDHPWVAAHPQWFRHRPDGSVQYAENPPKKYQDIYPFDFETDDWQALWQALKGIFDHWIAEGVTIFRVDNPHTKSFAFWEWCISAIKAERPDVLFLAEAFTRPKVMHRLAKLGFSQSYTYFTWRHSKQELVEYFTELAHGPGYHYFRPNAWPNTPDILDEALHEAGRPMFALRLLLAATLSSNYGLYGPAFELMENRPVRAASEEYLDSEKYQLRHWDIAREDSLCHLIARVNRIRRENAALHDNRSLRFMPCDNERLLAYSKRTPDGRNTILTVINLDAQQTQAGWVDVDLQALGLQPDTDYIVQDLLGGQGFTWRNGRNFVMLEPHHAPAHVFRVLGTARTERQFDGY